MGSEKSIPAYKFLIASNELYEGRMGPACRYRIAYCL